MFDGGVFSLLLIDQFTMSRTKAGVYPPAAIPDANSRICRDARGCDGSIRQELAEKMRSLGLSQGCFVGFEDASCDVAQLETHRNHEYVVEKILTENCG